MEPFTHISLDTGDQRPVPPNYAAAAIPMQSEIRTNSPFDEQELRHRRKSRGSLLVDEEEAEAAEITGGRRRRWDIAILKKICSFLPFLSLSQCDREDGTGKPRLIMAWERFRERRLRRYLLAFLCALLFGSFLVAIKIWVLSVATSTQRIAIYDELGREVHNVLPKLTYKPITDIWPANSSWFQGQLNSSNTQLGQDAIRSGFVEVDTEEHGRKNLSIAEMYRALTEKCEEMGDRCMCISAVEFGLSKSVIHLKGSKNRAASKFWDTESHFMFDAFIDVESDKTTPWQFPTESSTHSDLHVEDKWKPCPDYVYVWWTNRRGERTRGRFIANAAACLHYYLKTMSLQQK